MRTGLSGFSDKLIGDVELSRGNDEPVDMNGVAVFWFDEKSCDESVAAMELRESGLAVVIFSFSASTVLVWCFVEPW